VVGRDDLVIEGVDTVADAGPRDLTFMIDARRARGWGTSAAGAALVSDGLDVPGHDEQSRALIVVRDAEQSMIDALALFMPEEDSPPKGVDAQARIDATADIGRDVAVGPFVTVGPGARVGGGVVLHSGVRIGRDAVIGDDSVLHANVVVRDRCTVGRRVILHSGAAIGTDGFGYRPDPSGGGLRKMPHVGDVVIEDDVEIGANTCIDRAKFGSTVIGAGTKVDNLVQIAHNCRIGRSCVIAAQVGLAGSVTVGDGVQMGGQVGVAEHLTIGDGAQLGAQCGVLKDTPPGERVWGSPAQPARERLRQIAILRSLKSWMDDVKQRLDRLEH